MLQHWKFGRLLLLCRRTKSEVKYQHIKLQWHT